MTYEEAMRRLEEIVDLLSRQTITLEESLALYAEGTKLAGQCAKQLDDAELQLKTLLQKVEAHEQL